MKLDLTKPLQVRNLVTGKTYAATEVRANAYGHIFVTIGGAPEPTINEFSEDGSNRSPASVLALENAHDPEPPPAPAPTPLDLSNPMEVVSLTRTYPVDKVHRLANGRLLVIFDENSQHDVFGDGGLGPGALYIRNVPEPEPEKLALDCWVNVYKERSTDKPWLAWSGTRQDADEAAHPSRIACLHITREFTVGEGLE